jgi:CRISPR type III-B/RAMP module RAMP protein Cmr1
MEEAIFKVEIITPTIMGGANNNLDSILIRPTEIKSAMRQTFRLVAGKYVEHNKKGIEKLYELESEVFGNTEGKGKFRLIVEADNIETEEKVLLLPHKKPKDNRERGLDEKIKLPRKAIKSNQTFNLKIISYKYPVEFYKSLLNIAFLLGVGHRRNRLFGNMQMEQFELKNEVGKIEKFFLDKGYREIKTDNPLFACFSKRKNDDKNYLVYGIPLKDEFKPINEEKFENTLKNLYEKVIHKIEEKDNFKFILGWVKPRRQASFVNFSILKHGQNYKMYIISFYHKNENFDYLKWGEAVKEVKELAEKTFKK